MGCGNRLVKKFLTVIFLLGAAPVVADECRDDEVLLRGDWGQARFTVELAVTPKERNTGLMHRESMPRTAGMLFIYSEPGSRAFWMKNTLIPLDIIYLDETGTIVTLHEMARPHDQTPIFGGYNIQYVLEINGGMSGLLGITEGSQLRHPSIDAAIAAWPC